MKYLSALLGLLVILASCSIEMENKEVKLDFSGPLKLCFFGDGGTGTPQQIAVAKLLEEEKCQAYFYLGDIVYPKGISSANDPSVKRLFWDVYEPIFKKSPMFLMMGNHDYHGNVDAWLEVAKRHPNLYYPSHYYMARINELCFPVMNTADYKIEQLFWFPNLDLANCHTTILLGHHPAKSSGHHQGAYFPLNLFLNHALSYAQAYVAGHDHHLSHEGQYQGVEQFISGAAGKLRAVDSAKAVWAKSQMGFLTLTGKEGRHEFAFWGVGKGGAKEKLYSKKIFSRSLAND